MDDHEALRAELLRLELALAERRAADLPGGYAGAMHESFRETGASGRLWTRDSILAAMAGDEPTVVEITSFAVEPLADGVVLATYETAGARPARRASIWVLDGGRWRIRYHQGTLL
jgi:ribonuclease HI